MRRDAEVFSNADASEIRGQNLGVVGTNRAARVARFAVRAPIFPGGGVLIRVLAATDPQKPRDQPQPVEDEHQNHKRHGSYAAINYVIRHRNHPY